MHCVLHVCVCALARAYVVLQFAHHDGVRYAVGGGWYGWLVGWKWFYVLGIMYVHAQYSAFDGACVCVRACGENGSVDKVR